MLTLQWLLLNQYLNSLVSKEFPQALQYLEGPTLIYHALSTNSSDESVFLKLFAKRDVMVVSKGHCPYTMSTVTPKSSLLLTDDIEAMIESLRGCPLWQAHNKVLLVVPQDGYVKDWIANLWNKTRAVHVAAVVISDRIKYYTWFPYRPVECGTVQTITELNSTDLFPQKMYTNLNKCPLRAVVGVFPPMVIDDKRGAELKIFHDLAQKLNMLTEHVKLKPGQVIWQAFDKEGNISSGTKLLWENKVDIMFGTKTLTYNVINYVDGLEPHTVDDMAWFVPGPLPKSHVDSIYEALPLKTWGLVFTVSCVSYFTDLLLANFQPDGTIVPDSFLRTVAITLNMPTKLLNTSSNMKYLFVVCYIYSLHITTVYQSSFISFLSGVTYEKAIKTWGELAESDLKTILHMTHTGVLAHSPQKVLSMLETPNRTSYVNELKLAPVISPSDTAILAPKIGCKITIALNPHEYFDESGEPRVVQLKETVFTVSLRFLISKGNPLRPLLDKYTISLIEAGIPLHYVKELTKELSLRVTKLSPLDYEDIVGPLTLLLGMLCISVVLLTVELIVAKIKFRARIKIRSNLS